MTSYVLKLGGAAVLLLAAGVFGIVIFGNIWARVGIGAALVVVVGGLLLWAWNVDRKEREARAGVDELPRV
jgi:Flp pilus assembly protein TadB